MTDICAIALDILQNQPQVIPAENVTIQTFLHADWDGRDRIMITSSPSSYEEEPIGIMKSTLTIHCLSKSRSEAVVTNLSAKYFIRKGFEALERDDTSGIVSICLYSINVENIQNRNEFCASTAFEVLYR